VTKTKLLFKTKNAKHLKQKKLNKNNIFVYSFFCQVRHFETKTKILFKTKNALHFLSGQVFVSI